MGYAVAGNDLVQLRLRRNAVDQLLQGLETLAEDWDEPAASLEEGSENRARLAGDCRDRQEAERIARFYWQIIESIEQQLRAPARAD